jgi:hypothetical protein
MPNDPDLLEAALIGYQLQRERIDKAIAELRGKISGNKATTVSVDGERPKRRLSAGARRRMAAAQKKRWAAYRKKHG